MIKVSIIGAAGYTAGELIRILQQHPETEIIGLVSQSHAGKALHQAHPDLEGLTELVFSDQLPAGSDVIFLCSGHGKSETYLKEHIIPKETCIIDLSSDHRMSGSHGFVYGLPELNQKALQQARKIANPGCFATCIQLALLPLAQTGLLKEPVHVSAITGSTGAGQQPVPTTHFSWRQNNASVYKAFTHQHLGEIRQSLQQLQPDFDQPVHFIPMRGAFTRGILSAVYTSISASLEEMMELYQAYYKEHPFVQITGSSPDVKRVTGTNRALLHLTKENGNLLITAVIDNLIKGASGQAVQNMNLAFGLDQTTGLQLKPIAY